MKDIKIKWTGYITELLQDSFISRLNDTSNDGINECIELLYSDVLIKDKDCIQLGSCFTFEIGRKNNKDYKILKFFKSEKISKQDIIEAKLWAKEIKEGINWL